MNKKMWIFLTILVNLIFMVSCNSKKNKSVGFEVDSVLISKVIKYDDSLSNSNYPDGYIESIYTNSNKSIIVIGLRDYGLLMSTDNGHHWQKITNGIDMPDATVHDISEDRVREIYYYASDDGVYKSSDDLHSFVRIANALPFELNKIGGRGSMVRNIVVDEVTGDLYARVVKDNFGIYKLDYADKEWYSIGNGLPTGSATQNLCFSSKDNAVYISNGIGGFLTITENDYAMGVYRGKKNNQGGYTWSSTKLPVHPNKEPCQTIKIDPVSGYIYAGTFIGLFRYDFKNWLKVFEVFNCTVIVFEKELPNRALLFSNNYVYLKETGKQWCKLENIWNQIAINTSAAFFKGNLLIGTNTGLYFSSDNGKNWKKIYCKSTAASQH